MRKLLGSVLITLSLFAVGCSGSEDGDAAADAPEMNEAKPAKSAAKGKIPAALVGVWETDQGSQREVFVFRADGTFLRAFAGIEQSRSAMDTQRHEGKIKADDDSGTLTVTKVREGERTPAPVDFEYQIERRESPDGDAIVELHLNRDDGGPMLEGQTTLSKTFMPNTTWCTAENHCAL